MQHVIKLWGEGSGTLQPGMMGQGWGFWKDGQCYGSVGARGFTGEKRHPELLPQPFHARQGNYHVLPSPSENSYKAAVGRYVTALLSSAPWEGRGGNSTTVRSTQHQPRSPGSAVQRPEVPAKLHYHKANMRILAVCLCCLRGLCHGTPLSPQSISPAAGCSACSHPELIPSTAVQGGLLAARPKQTLTASITKEKCGGWGFLGHPKLPLSSAILAWVCYSLAGHKHCSPV